MVCNRLWHVTNSDVMLVKNALKFKGGLKFQKKEMKRQKNKF